MADGGDESAEWGARKPVKPDDDLVAYVRALEVPLTTPSPDNSTPLLLRGLFHEIRKREASVATHKLTNRALEAAIDAASPLQLAAVVARMSPYVQFVACNRFGSRMLEAAARRAAALFAMEPTDPALAPAEEDDDGGDEGSAAAGWASEAEWAAAASAAAVPPSLTAATATPLHHLAAALAVCSSVITAQVAGLVFDVAGTHVVRAWAALLAGRAPAPTQRRDDGTAGDAGGRGAAGTSWKQAAAAGVGAGGGSGGVAFAGWPSLPHEAAVAFTAALVQLTHALGDADHGDAAPPAGAAAAVDGADSAAALIARLPAPVPTPSTAPANERNVLALACDTNAGPTLQLLLDCTAVTAPATCRYLLRRCINWSCAGMPPGDRSGAHDVMAVGGRSAAATGTGPSAEGVGRKRRRRRSEAAPAGGAGEGDVDDAGGAPGAHHHCNELLAHAVGSHLMESVLLHADGQLFGQLWQGVFSGNLTKWAGHGSANYAIQRLLVACRTGEQVQAAVTELLPSVPALVAAKRDGVVWHLVAACVGGARFGAVAPAGGDPTARTGPAGGAGGGTSGGGGKGRLPLVPLFVGALGRAPAALQASVVVTLVQAAAAGVGASGAATAAAAATKPKGAGKETASAGTATGTTGAVTAPPPASHAALRANSAHIVRWWLDVDGYRAKHPSLALAAPADKPALVSPLTPGPHMHALPVVSVSPVGARILAAVLRLDLNIPVVREFADAVVTLPPGDLAPIVGDPFLSRAVFEALLDDGDARWLRGKLYHSLRGCFPSLAGGRFACWTVTKLFHALEDDRKRSAIASELVEVERALEGSPSGRQVARALRLDHYKRNPDSWLASWARVSAKAALLADIVGDGGGGGGGEAGAKRPKRG